MADQEALNVFKHVLVPKHIILNAEEKKELFKTYKITEDHLPHILKSDPAAKALGAKEGDIIKIERKSQVAGAIPYFRLVVKK